MADVYTSRKLAIQGQFGIGSLAEYTGQRKALHGTVTVIAHERKGGVIVDADGVRAVVSPFSLLPVASVRPPRTRGRADAPAANGHAPTARIIRHGVPLVPAKRRTVPTSTGTVATDATVGTDALARLRGIGQPSAPPPPVAPPATPPPLSPPLGKGNVEAFFVRWLRDWRRATSRAMRQTVIDHFTLPVYLRDVVPPEPGLWHYRQAIYFIAAAQLADPARVPPLPDIQVTVAQRFKVSEEAVKVHLTWMRKRLAADHATFLAQHAPVEVPS